ncbi:MAG: hypothetical protein ACLR8Y_00440 [Alistipes indistinctus]
MENASSTLIEPHVYEVLDKEFGANKAETVNIREKINQKLEAVSLGNRKDGAPAEDDADFKKEVIIKSGVISVKDEVAAMSTPKILGKIDLSGKKPLQRLPKRRNLSFLRRRASRRLHPPQSRNPLRLRPSKANRFRSLPPRRLKPRRRHPLPLRPLRLCQPPHQTATAAAPAAKAAPKAVAPAPASKPAAVAENLRHSLCPLFRPVRPMAAAQTQTYDERVAADQTNLFRPNSEEKPLVGTEGARQDRREPA